MTWLWFLGNKMTVADLEGAADDEARGSAGTFGEDFSTFANGFAEEAGVEEEGGDVS